VNEAGILGAIQPFQTARNERATVTFDIEIVLRNRDEAITRRLRHEGNDVPRWTELDVQQVLKSMLLAIEHAKNPDSEQDYVALRGFSWIVEPTSGGVVIAIEIPMGAAVAGPFDIAQARLDSMISRVLSSNSVSGQVIH
jgi:hypothetical protein